MNVGGFVRPSSPVHTSPIVYPSVSQFTSVVNRQTSLTNGDAQSGKILFIHLISIGLDYLFIFKRRRRTANHTLRKCLADSQLECGRIKFGEGSESWRRERHLETSLAPPCERGSLPRRCRSTRAQGGTRKKEKLGSSHWDCLAKLPEVVPKGPLGSNRLIYSEALDCISSARKYSLS